MDRVHYVLTFIVGGLCSMLLPFFFVYRVGVFCTFFFVAAVLLLRVIRDIVWNSCSLIRSFSCELAYTGSSKIQQLSYIFSETSLIPWPLHVPISTKRRTS